MPKSRFPLFVEMYQPQSLDGRPDEVGPCAVEKIVGKAKQQLGRSPIDIVTIGGFDLTVQSIGLLEQAAPNCTTHDDMPSFAGLTIVSVGSEISQTSSGAKARPIIHVRHALNQRYFSGIAVEGESEHETAQSSTERRVLLPITEERARCHTVVHGNGPKVPPLFLGKGPVDFACNSCGTVLAKGVWDHSISTVVAKCPIRGPFGLFAAPSAPMALRVLLLPGHLNLSDHVDIRHRIVLDGSESGAKDHRPRVHPSVIDCSQETRSEGQPMAPLGRKREAASESTS